MTRKDDLDRFYRLLDRLEQRVDGAQKLKNCTGYMDWPRRGVYFFLEPGETRESTDQLRVTRVGTHAVSDGSSTSLWDRLKQHYGTGSGSSNHPHGGAHRGSVYRKLSARLSLKSTTCTTTILSGTIAGRALIVSGQKSVTRNISSSDG